MRNLNRNQKNFQELEKVINVCSRLLKVWIIEIPAIVAVISIAIIHPVAGIIVFLVITIIFFSIDVFLSVSLFFYGEEDYKVRRQRKILIIVWLIDIFLGFAIIPSWVAKYFFYKGYKELIDYFEER